jgi:hypothetical protein
MYDCRYSLMLHAMQPVQLCSSLWMRICTYICVRVYVMYVMYVCMYVCMYVWKYTLKMPIYLCASEDRHVYECMYVHMCVYIYNTYIIRIYIYTHTHTHTYKHTHNFARFGRHICMYVCIAYMHASIYVLCMHACWNVREWVYVLISPLSCRILFEFGGKGHACIHTYHKQSIHECKGIHKNTYLNTHTYLACILTSLPTWRAFDDRPRSTGTNMHT